MSGMSGMSGALQKAVRPEFLKDVTNNGFNQICADYSRLTHIQRRGLCLHLVDSYHIQRNIKNPMLAAHELMLRLVYEVCFMFCFVCLFCANKQKYKPSCCTCIGLYQEDHAHPTPRWHLALSASA